MDFPCVFRSYIDTRQHLQPFSNQSTTIMTNTPFSKKEQAQIKESILKTTDLNIQDILKRTKYNSVIIQCAYEVGHEIIELKKLLRNTGETNVTFGGLPGLLDSNDSVIAERIEVVENMIAVRRKIEKLVTEALQNRIHFFLYSDNRFLCYTKDNMRMDKHSMLSNLKQIEIMKLVDKKESMQAVTKVSNVAEDLSDIYKKRGMNVYNSVDSSLDMEQLQQDYLQCNKDMLHMFEIKCGRKSLAFFKSLYAASSEEIPDNQYVAITECTDESSLNYLLHLGIIEHHPHNSHLVRMTCI